MTILDKIKDIELEMARTQKNKATEGHLGILKSKLAKLRTELLEGEKSGGGGKGTGFEVSRHGDARIALIGFPSVGKSTILNTFTTTKSETAAYEFTTLTCIPGVIHYNDARIQLLDLPGIIEGAAEGKGRGRQVIAVAKSADLVLIVLDAGSGKAERQRELLERELEIVGIRLNKKPPDVYFKKKKTGGVSIASTCKLVNITEKDVQQILHEYRIHNAEVLFREDCTVDEFIDIIEGNRSFIKCLYVYNKIDMTSIEEADRISRLPHSLVLSCQMKLNHDVFLMKIWQYLDMVRAYTKPRGQPPDLSDPIVLTSSRHGITVESACKQIHRDLASSLDYALVWGQSSKHNPQRCGLGHELCDEDVIQIVKKKVDKNADDPFTKKQGKESKAQVKKAKAKLKT